MPEMKISNGIVFPGPLRDSEQTFQSSSEEHRPGDESRDDGGCRAGEDPEQLSSGRLCCVTAGWSSGETQCPEEEGEGYRCTHRHTSTCSCKYKHTALLLSLIGESYQIG